MAARLWTLFLGASLGGLVLAQPSEKEPAAVILVNSTGKELKLTGVKFTQGARRLAWLANPRASTDDDRRGPLAFELREPHSTTFQKGVVTLVPTASVTAIRYEYDKQEMTIAVNGLDEPLKGTLVYRGINVCGVEGKVGEVLGRFTGGIAKDGFHSISFPNVKPLPVHAPGGLVWSVRIDQAKAGHPILVVRNLKAIYSWPGGVETLSDNLPVRKRPMEVVSFAPPLKKLEIVAVDPNMQMAVVELTTGDGTAQEKLVAIPLTCEQEGRTGVLAGLLGEVDAGWKLFPLHAVKSIELGEPKP